MKIILLKDVKNLGVKNDILDVSDGYAKNFLLKEKLAIAFSSSTAKTLNEKLANDYENYLINLEEAKKLKWMLESKTYQFTLKTHNGNQFGKISSKQLIDEINGEQNLVNKFMLQKTHTWNIGDSIIEFKIHPDVIANVKISITEINN